MELFKFLKVETQLLPGFNFSNQDGIELRNKVSQFLSPAILQTGLGFYFKKSQNFWLNLSPITGRVIIVSKKYTNELEEGSKYFGVDKNKGARYFFGALFDGYFKKKLQKTLFGKINLTSISIILKKLKMLTLIGMLILDLKSTV